jgi:hypothetical protein
VRVTRVADTRAAIQAANPQSQTNQELSHLLVIFAHSPQGMTFAQLVAPSGPPNPLGAIPVSGPGITGNATRTLYHDGPLQPADMLTTAFPLAGQGVPAMYHTAAIAPWQQYTQRIRDMKQIADAVATSHSQLIDALSGRRH